MSKYDRNIENTIELLGKLIGFKTISYSSNMELMSFIEKYLSSFGISSQFIYSDDKTRANLLACIGPADSALPGIVVSGHTDVVPSTGQAWTKPDFVMTREAGRLYGRGTTDMKGFIATVLGVVPYWQSLALKRPIYLAFSYDEEVGCLGVRSMLDVMRTLAVPPLACIIGEPTALKPVYGHKGKMAIRCELTGLAAHSAYTNKGVNAIEYAAELITHICQVAQQLQQPEKQNARFDPPWSTIQIGTIKGGQAVNIVAEKCSFDFEIRALPGMDIYAVLNQIKQYASTVLLPAMQTRSKDCAIVFTELAAYPALETSRTGFLAELMKRLTGISEDATVSFGTEGGLFSEQGIESIVYGPGSMDQGHKPDEYIEIEQLQACDAVLRSLGRLLQE